MKTIIKLFLLTLLMIPLVTTAQQEKKEKPADSKLKSQQVQSKQDSIYSDLVDFSASAYQYRIRPAVHGGGEGKYIGFKPPKNAPKGVKIIEVTANHMVIKKGSTVATLDSVGRITFK